MPAEDWHVINTAFLAVSNVTPCAYTDLFHIGAYIDDLVGGEEVVFTIHAPPPPPPLSAFSLQQAG
jgi:hypothetical protein